MRALSNVVLPDPVPPETRMLRRDRNTRSASARTFLGSAPCFTRSSAENARLPKAADGDSDLRTGGRNADSNPRSVIEPGIDNGRGRRVQSQRTGDMDSGP